MTLTEEFNAFYDTFNYCYQHGDDPGIFDEVSLATLTKVKAFIEANEKQTKEAKPITETGAKIVQYMQNSKEGTFTSKTIAAGMGVNSRSIAGAMRKLVTDGYVNKAGKDPLVYALSDKGKEFTA